MLIQSGYTAALLPSGEAVDWQKAAADIAHHKIWLNSQPHRVAVTCDCSYLFFVSMMATFSLGK
jgi:hypothetical protein